MKKLLYMCILVLCSSCETFDRAYIETDCFVVVGVKKVQTTGDQHKQYLVNVDTKTKGGCIPVGFYTDKLFHVGDTLRISK